MISNQITDKSGTVVERVVRSEGWVIKQVRQSDGTWWNIRVERETGR